METFYKNMLKESFTIFTSRLLLLKKRHTIICHPIRLLLLN